MTRETNILMNWLLGERRSWQWPRGTGSEARSGVGSAPTLLCPPDCPHEPHSFGHRATVASAPPKRHMPPHEHMTACPEFSQQQ